MRFIPHTFGEIKGQVSGLYDYNELLKQQFTGDISQCLSSPIKVFESHQGDIYRFVLVSGGQQIGNCIVINNDKENCYFVSSIAILPNLQKQGIGHNFYTHYLQSYMQKHKPGYRFEAGPYQTSAGIKLHNKS